MDAARGESIALVEARTLLKGEPAAVESRRRCYGWIVDPPGMVLVCERNALIDDEVARFVTSTVDVLMRQSHPGAARFYYLHDFSRTAENTSSARKLFLEWGVRSINRVQEASAVMPGDSGTMARMAVATTLTAMRALGVYARTYPSLAAAVAKLQVRAFSR